MGETHQHMSCLVMSDLSVIYENTADDQHFHQDKHQNVPNTHLSFILFFINIKLLSDHFKM